MALFLYIAILNVITMIQLDKLLHNFKTIRNGGDSTDDLKLSSRQLEFIFNHFRAEVAAQRVNNRKSIEGFKQSLNDLKLATTKDFRPIKGYMLRTVDPFPAVVNDHKGLLLDYVGTRDSERNFLKSSVRTFNLDMENPYLETAYFIESGYLYICTKRLRSIREVYVSGVFSDPRKVMELNGANPNALGYSWDYPLPANLIGQVNNMVINNEYRWMSILPADLTNDGVDGE